jgi:hypothetical protein
VLENNWCYMKDPNTNYAALGLADGPERLPEWKARWCIDCADQSLANSLCTFSTDYFTTQPGANITCPARSETASRTGASGPYSAMTKFWADTQVYRYPYCSTDLTFYTQTPVKTAAPAVDYSGGATCGDCEYAEESYNACQSSFPGFKSPASVSPTEAVEESKFS